MILVRDIFQLHFGRAKEALALAKEEAALAAQAGLPPARILTDLTGDYYTLITESTFDNLADLEATLDSTSQNEAWRDWYARFTERLAEHNIFVLPGTVFELPGYLRLSLTANDAMIARALPGFEAAIIGITRDAVRGVG